MRLDLRSLRLALLSGAVALIAGPVLAQTPPAKPPAAKPPAAAAPATVKDPVVAIVNGQQVRLSELEIAQQSLPQQYRSMPLQAVFPALLERIIDSKLVVQEGKKTNEIYSLRDFMSLYFLSTAATSMELSPSS